MGLCAFGFVLTAHPLLQHASKSISNCVFMGVGVGTCSSKKASILFSTFVSGYLLSLSLILAIGAQNAFVLRQGLRRSHVFWVCLACALSDAVLICAGIAGFGTLAQKVPWFETAMRYGGAGFLIWYGWRNAVSAWRGGQALEAEGANRSGLLVTLTTVLALTWLNPHVYLDTVVLIGSISAQYQDQFVFGVGAVLASFSFFFALGYGARFLAPMFARPRSWQILDALIALTMWAIAAGLIFS
jgi:L-lysine exporter family protein LysE/ArgO